MRRKQGISLIVLVITIIVMIILAASVVIALSDTGIINRASQAVNLTDEASVQDLAAIMWADAYIGNKRGTELISEVTTKLREQGVTADKWNITVTDIGVSVTSKNNVAETSWKIEREYNADGKITKAMVTDGTVTYEIGTTINYMPNGVGATSYKGGWKLLGADDKGRLLIMSADSITGSNIEMYSEDGYINGLVYLQNAVNSYKDGIIGVEVRSVTAEDIDAVTGYDSNSFTGEEVLQTVIDFYTSIGQPITEAELLASLGFTQKSQMALMDNNMVVTYYWDGTEYPKYSYTKNGVTTTGNLLDSHSSTGFKYYDVSTNSFKTVAYTTTGTIATLTNDAHTYYAKLKYTEESKAYNMLFMMPDGSSTSEYWLASRYINSSPNYTDFGMLYISDSAMAVGSLVDSKNYAGRVEYEARAVVTLASGITLKDSITIPGTYDIVQ